ncbi:siderophore-interacting protein [Skermanella stibiiresistens]|uniref:siderophore-interacting protein n=1 Tax=Skermanella stibiiresistens TaxID=913326 RepID=UPI0004B267A2|nr:siderophore-interacting protein [Skermanella stibiiresistens]
MTEVETAPRRTPPRLLQVLSATRVTPRMLRVTLGGADMAGFPEGSDGSHIKVFLPLAGQDRPVLPTLGPKGPVWPPRDQRPITRTYTVRRHHAGRGELEIDFVLHDDAGPASSWAAAAKPGNFIGLAGPAGPDRVIRDADWHVMAGDMSALPAIAAALESLPAAARGHAFIEVPDAGERQRIDTASQVTIHWLHRDEAGNDRADLLEQAVRAMPWPDGTLSATIAGESGAVVAIRDYLRRERGLDRNAIYAVPYWKASLTEEGYHEERHRIMDTMD